MDGRAWGRRDVFCQTQATVTMMQLHGPSDLRGRRADGWEEERGALPAQRVFARRRRFFHACRPGHLGPTAKAAKMMMRHQMKARLTHSVPSPEENMKRDLPSESRAG